jgi:uncharacterized membrane protein
LPILHRQVFQIIKMTKKECLGWILICFVHNFFINNYYRSYIYVNDIYDYGIADIGNNISFIPGIYFSYLIIKKKFVFSKVVDIWVHFFILSIVEIFSAFIPHIGTFDPKDILGLFIGAVLLYFFIKNKKIYFIKI